MKQIIEMKESRAQMMNDCLSGKISSEVSKPSDWTHNITLIINVCVGGRADSEQDVRGRIETWIDHQTGVPPPHERVMPDAHNGEVAHLCPRN